MQPGSYLLESPQVPVLDSSPTAMPVFIGYTQTGRQAFPIRIRTFGDFERVFGLADPAGEAMLYWSVRQFFDSGGQDCYALSCGSFEDFRSRGENEFFSGIFSKEIHEVLRGIPEITLLCLPDSTCRNRISASHKMDGTLCTLWGHALEYCLDQQHAFAIFDAPSDISKAVECLGYGFGHLFSYGACYWPPLITSYFNNNGARLSIPPCGAVAAAFAVNDKSRGFWHAPANLALNGVAVRPSAASQGEALFSEDTWSINLIRSFPGRGTRVWGARTLASASEQTWLYIQTRRTVSLIARELKALAANFVFGPNAPVAWRQFEALATLHLKRMWQNGALIGAQQRDAFTVQVGPIGEATDAYGQDRALTARISLRLAAPAENILIELALQTESASPAEVGDA